jgi:excisionase family DNA binding protein
MAEDAICWDLAKLVAGWDDLTEVPEAELARDIREERDGRGMRVIDPQARVGVSMEWLTTGKAATLLGVSASTVRRRIHSGDIEARRLPEGHWRIGMSVVEELRRRGFATADDGWPPEHPRK